MWWNAMVRALSFDETCFVLFGGVVLMCASIGIMVLRRRTNNDDKKRGCKIVSVLFGLYSLGLFGYGFYQAFSQANYTVEREKSIAGQLEKVQNMQRELRKQMEFIAAALSKNQSDIETYTKEIIKEKDLKKITSFEQSTERIRYNIQLIQEVDVYQRELVKVKRITEQGLEEAIYIERRLGPKDRMIQVIGEGKMLGQDVENLLKKYSPLINRYVIDPHNLIVKTPEEIWRQIVK